MAFMIPVAQVMQGNAQNAAFKYNAAIDDRNAKVNEMQGDQLVLSSEVEIDQFQKDFEDVLAATSQAYRYNGFVAGTGTALDVAMENASEADREIRTRRYNASIGKQQAEESAVMNRLQGNLNRMYGRQARLAGYINAGSSLLQMSAQAAAAAG